jgi:predicted lipoprotein with Yx(FWY)xxD motif
MGSSLIAIAALASTLLGGGSQPPAERSADHERGAPVTKLSLKSSPYGRVLFSGGYALYVFTSDRRSTSDCYGDCAEAWPPLEADGRLVAGPGVRQRLIGTTKRDDGSRQVTYRGKPLYGYVDDPRGEVLCHDVFEFGGTWYAVRAGGRPAPH